MPDHDGQSSRVVSATREVTADPDTIFELIANPAHQSRWDGYDNLDTAPAGQRIRAVGEVFTVTLTHGAVRENHVADKPLAEEGVR